jgi:cysteine-rich repeat protein
VLGSEEDCEGDLFRWDDCIALGFSAGDLACNDDCTFNLDDCSGTESCRDGEDNDGDGLADCVDTDDCADVCGDPCQQVFELDDPGSVSGVTAGSADLTDASCSSGGSGPELAYQIVASSTGILEVELTTGAALSVSLRTACDAPETELGCSLQYLSVPVTEGDTLHAVVEGVSADEVGRFSLQARSRPTNVCGDGVRDEDEECDDENSDSGDGCGEDCQLESSETEPNEAAGTATVHSDPCFAQVAPAGDVDVFSVAVAEGPASLMVSTHSLGDGACALERLDSLIEILDTNGSTVLSTDDDSGEGLCARASAWALGVGTYYVRVTASPNAENSAATFPYRLDAQVELCGNGEVAAGEQCDDGNTASGDGCSSLCRNE